YGPSRCHAGEASAIWPAPHDKTRLKRLLPANSANQEILSQVALSFCVQEQKGDKSMPAKVRIASFVILGGCILAGVTSAQTIQINRDNKTVAISTTDEAT